MIARRLVAMVAVCTLLGVAGEARADEAEAAEQFKAGAAAYARSDFRAAAQAFERAYRAEPRAAAIYNGGLAWEAANERERAADDYSKALALPDLAPAQAADARSRLGALEKTLGKVDVTAPSGATVSVGHVERALAPITIHLTPGSHDVAVTLLDGTTDRRSVVIAAGAPAALAFEAPKPRVTPEKPPPPPVQEETKAMPTRKLLGFVAVGGGVVAGGAAIILGLSAVSAKDDFDASGHHDQDLHDKADSLRTMTNVCWVAAGVLAGAGVVLILTAPSASSPGTSAVLGPGGGAIRVRF
jgi:hypothetical protein